MSVAEKCIVVKKAFHRNKWIICFHFSNQLFGYNKSKHLPIDDIQKQKEFGIYLIQKQILQHLSN